MDTCSICIEELDDLFKLTCNHGFCKKCISKLLVYSIKCPNCRKEINPMEISKIKPIPKFITWFYIENRRSVKLFDPLASVMEFAFSNPKPHNMKRFQWHDLMVDTNEMEIINPRTMALIGELNRIELKPLIINKYIMYMPILKK